MPELTDSRKAAWAFLENSDLIASAAEVQAAFFASVSSGMPQVYIRPCRSFK
jgi:hypothetical protein